MQLSYNLEAVCATRRSKMGSDTMLVGGIRSDPVFEQLLLAAQLKHAVKTFPPRSHLITFKLHMQLNISIYSGLHLSSTGNTKRISAFLFRSAHARQTH